MSQNEKGQLGVRLGQEWARVWGRLRCLSSRTWALQFQGLAGVRDDYGGWNKEEQC
jgi:hypothetical protein